MRDEELNELLKTFDGRLNHSIAINLQTAKEVKLQKSVFALNKLWIFSILETIIGTIFAIFIGNFIYENLNSLSLKISALILDFFTIIAISGAIRQIILVSEFEVSSNVTESQKILATLQTHRLKYLRLAILQFPFFFAYILVGFKLLFNTNIWETGDQNWIISNIIFGIILFPVAIWAYRKIQPANLNIKWVRTLVEMIGGKEISNAMTFLSEIEEFKN